MAWLGDWSKRIKITIDKDQVDGDLSNFPVPIYLSASSGQNNDDVSAIFDELSVIDANANTTYLDEDMADITDWTNADAVNGASSQVTFDSKSCMKLDTGTAATGNYANRWRDVGTFGNRVVVELSVYLDKAGDYTNKNYFLVGARKATVQFAVVLSSEGLYVRNASDHQLIDANIVLEDVWQKWTFDIDFTTPASSTVDIYLDGILKYSDVDCSYETASTEGLVQLLQFGDTTNDQIAYVDYIKVGDGFDPPVPKKIAITTSDEETQCYTEIERWDWPNEKAWLHAKIPTIVSGTNTELYIYYDSTQPDNTTYVDDVGSAPAQSVWDSNFKAVYHLGEDPTTGSGCMLDSTSNINHGTPAGSMTSDNLVDGQFGKCLDFDGADDEVDFGACNNIDFLTNKTIETIINPNTVGEGNAGRIIRKGGGANGWGVHLYTGNYIYYAQGASTDGWWRIASNLNQKHLAITYNNSSVSNDPIFYVDGVAQSIQSEANPVGTIADDSAYDMTLASIPTGTYCFDGKIDEVRISSVIRTPAWINATYEGLWDNLLTYSNVLYPPGITCSGTVQVDSVFTAGIDVRLYRRSTGEFVGEDTTISGGLFEINSGFEEYHYVVALYTTSGTNALIYDYIHP
jgi:hypothetical protein